MNNSIYTEGRDLNHVAWLYDPLIEKLSFGREQKFREMTLQHMEFSPTDHILDIGCGTGSLTLLIARQIGSGGRVMGIDAAPKMIDIARRKAKKMDSYAEFEAGISEKLQFADASFDCVVNSMFTHHINTELKRQSFKEMYRVLKPGGKLVTVDIDRPTTLLGKVLGWGGRYLLFQEELVDNLKGSLPALIEEAGFEGVELKNHVYGLISLFCAVKKGGKM